MRVYIDLANLLSFFGSSQHPKFEDALRMLKSQCDLYFNFSKDVLISDEALRAIILQLTSGSKDSPKPKFFDELFPARPLKSNFHTVCLICTLSVRDLIKYPNHFLNSFLHA